MVSALLRGLFRHSRRKGRGMTRHELMLIDRAHKHGHDPRVQAHGLKPLAVFERLDETHSRLDKLTTFSWLELERRKHERFLSLPGNQIPEKTHVAHAKRSQLLGSHTRMKRFWRIGKHELRTER